MEKSLRKDLVKAAQGLCPCDLCIENVQVVNVFTSEILPAKVYIHKEYIVDVDYYNSSKTYANQHFDGLNKFLCPGLIDSHLHIESSMLTPQNFAKAVIPCGTTTLITDPHELANVLGVKGVKYAIESSANLPMNQYVLVPSCVPSVENMENTGAKFFAEEIDSLLSEERVLGIAEIMDYIGVINSTPRMADIIDVGHKKNMFLQGHAPRLRDGELSAYICGGPVSCHECREGDEALEKLRKGMYVDARESSISKNIKAIVESLPDKKRIPSNFTLCTDDKEASDIIHIGHMNNALKVAVNAGLDPVSAVTAATINVANQVGLTEIGAIAPCRYADMVLFDDLVDFKPHTVFYKGEVVAQDGVMVKEIQNNIHPVETYNSIHIKDIQAQDLALTPTQSSKNEVLVNIMSYASPLDRVSNVKQMLLPVKNGVVDISNHDNLNYVAVINRYEGNDNICLGVIENFHINEGAFAGTVGHDSHNLTVVYTNIQDAIVAINKIKEMHGGIVCVKNREVKASIALPIAGLLTPLPLQEAATTITSLNKILQEEFGMDFASPIMRISTITLIVMPNVKFSDMGLVDVTTQKFIEIFPQ